MKISLFPSLARKILAVVVLTQIGILLSIAAYRICNSILHTFIGQVGDSITSYGTPLIMLLSVLSASFLAVAVLIPLVLSLFGKAATWYTKYAVHILKRMGRVSISALSSLAIGLLLGRLHPALFLLSYVFFVIVLVQPNCILGVLRLDWVETLSLFSERCFKLRYFVAESLRLPFGEETAVGAVQVTQMPKSYLDSNTYRIDGKELAQRLSQLLLSLSSSRKEFALHISFREGIGSITLLLKARDKNSLRRKLEEAASEFNSFFPDFTVKTTTPTDRAKATHATGYQIVGVPTRRTNPLKELTEYFTTGHRTGDYIVLSRVKKPSPITAFLLRRRYKKLGGESLKQTSTETLRNRRISTQEPDYSAQEELKDIEQELKRYHGSRVLKCWVYVTASAGTEQEARLTAERAANILAASLTSEKQRNALQIRRTPEGRIGKVLSDLRPIGEPTILLPSEATPYYWIPQTDMGIGLTRTAEFKTPPIQEGTLTLGRVIRHGRTTERNAKISHNSLSRHLFIAGSTGSGKTNTCHHLLIQLHKLRIPFLVVEPVKSEYRSLVQVIPELRIFTLGDEQTAPFRLNPFEIPLGVKTQTHLDNIKATFKASYALYPPMPYVLEESLTRLYENRGWNLLTNERGKTPTLTDLYNEIEDTTRQLGYEPKLTMDIEAALKTRIRNLTLGAKGAMLNTDRSIPVEELLRYPTVLELKRIGDEEEKALLTALILIRLHEHLEAIGPSSKLRHVTVIEEAHRLLTNVDMTALPEAADPRRRVVTHLANMLSEARAYGEGIIILEQIPTKIIPDAIKNSHTKIVHRLLAKDDRETLAATMNLSVEQTEALTDLGVGEAVVSTDEYPIPFKIKVPNTTKEQSRNITIATDSEVYKHMKPYYNIHPIEPPPPRAQIHSGRQHLEDKARAIVKNSVFQAGFKQAFLSSVQSRDEGRLAGYLIICAAAITEDDDEKRNLAKRILAHATEQLQLTQMDTLELTTITNRRIEEWRRRCP